MTKPIRASQLPSDYKQDIIAFKRQLKQQIGDVQGLFDTVCQRIEVAISEVKAAEKELGTAWPQIHISDLSQKNYSQDFVDLVKKRGCVVVKETFTKTQALAMDASMLDYLDKNKFDEVYQGPGDNFFGTLAASKPEIYPIYWSQAQMQARQSQEISDIQSFLNHLWIFEENGEQYFDPNTSIIYPDRIRRRPPGTVSQGLGAHTDSGALERWLLPEYQKVFAPIFNQDLDAYDPWNAKYRVDVDEYEVENTTKCSVFRTFQGWTALSDMIPHQGLLHVVPIPEAMAYILLRPLLDDVPEDELCGVAPGRVLPINEQWHPHLMSALSSIPALDAGDSVWWHCDVIHSVAPVEDQKGWGNVMYIPAAPMCEKNAVYAGQVKEALEKGISPPDFPQEDYETNWHDRFTPQMLNGIGKKALGIK